MISLKSFKDSLLTPSDITAELRKVISIQDIFILPDVELVYRSLKQFNFKKLQQNNFSVSSYAQKVLSATRMLKNVDDPITVFVRVFLEKGKDLLYIKNQLEAEAKSHLFQVQVLIDEYEMQNFIKGYKNSPSTPRNSEERKLLTFYKRTLAKKEEIVNYLLFGVLEKAYSRAAPGLSSPFTLEFKELEMEMNRHEDFPYLEMPYGFEIKYILNLEKLDYRLINTLRNKLDWMNQHLVHLADYTAQVDQHLQSKIHAKPFFSNLILELEAIPVVRDRKVMFEEMKMLFDEKKWYALYALALPQVEGIFSEIINLLTKDKVKGSLTEKVNYLRAYYDHAHYTFDYYEFTLADLRNSFAHSGKVADPERKCYRLLLDISYLLKIFMEFDSPLSKLAKVIRDGHNDFRHIGHFSSFLKLYAQAKAMGKIETIKPQADHFVYQVLLKKVNLEKMIRKLESDFKRSLDLFNKGLSAMMKEPSFHIFSSEISSFKDKIAEIENAYQKLPILMSEHLKILLDSRNVIFNFPTHFSKTPKAIKRQMDAFKVLFEKEFKLLNFLLSKTSKLVPEEEFILQEKYLAHRIQ